MVDQMNSYFEAPPTHEWGNEFSQYLLDFDYRPEDGSDIPLEDGHFWTCKIRRIAQKMEYAEDLEMEISEISSNSVDWSHPVTQEFFSKGIDKCYWRVLSLVAEKIQNRSIDWVSLYPFCLKKKMERDIWDVLVGEKLNYASFTPDLDFWKSLLTLDHYVIDLVLAQLSDNTLAWNKDSKEIIRGLIVGNFRIRILDEDDIHPLFRVVDFLDFDLHQEAEFIFSDSRFKASTKASFLEQIPENSYSWQEIVRYILSVNKPSRRLNKAIIRILDVSNSPELEGLNELDIELLLRSSDEDWALGKDVLVDRGKEKDTRSFVQISDFIMQRKGENIPREINEILKESPPISLLEQMRLIYETVARPLLDQLHQFPEIEIRQNALAINQWQHSSWTTELRTIAGSPPPNVLNFTTYERGFRADSDFASWDGTDYVLSCLLERFYDDLISECKSICFNNFSVVSRGKSFFSCPLIDRSKCISARDEEFRKKTAVYARCLHMGDGNTKDQHEWNATPMTGLATWRMSHRTTKSSSSVVGTTVPWEVLWHGSDCTKMLIWDEDVTVVDNGKSLSTFFQASLQSFQNLETVIMDQAEKGCISPIEYRPEMIRT